MRGRWIILSLAIALVAGCTDFSSIDRGVCGNGLLEQGEDCDSSDARCVRCAVTCSVATDCPTADYACGVDGLCHAPGGGLAPPHSAGTFEANELRVTDVDHDGLGDAMGLTKTSVVIRHGDATGQLSTLDSLITPTQTGPAALGDLDGDGSLDLTLTTLDGLVSYTSTYDGLAPLAVTGTILDKGTMMPLDIRRFIHIAPKVLAGLLVASTGDVGIIVLDGSQNVTKQFVVPPCYARLGFIKGPTIDQSSVDIYNVSKDGDNGFDAVVSFVVTTPGGRRSCVQSIHRDPTPIIGNAVDTVINDVTPTAYGTAVAKPIFADLDEDNADGGCPGIVRQDTGIRSLSYYDGTKAASGCTVAQTATALTAAGLPGPPAVAVVVGRAPVQPSYFSVAADGLVTNGGVYAFFPTGYFHLTAPQFQQVYATPRTITLVANGDFNGDDNVDVAIAAAEDQDVDMLFRVPGQPGFNQVRLDTTSNVTTLTTGDFDGNGIADIAYSEDLGDHERLSVAFGTPDRPLDPISVGVFSSIADVSRMGFPDSVDYLGLADDLLVLQPGPNSTVRLAILHGSPQRTLLSYFDPRPEGTQRDDTQFRGAVIGHFVTGSDTPELADLMALAPPKSANGATGLAPVKAYKVKNTLDGLDGSVVQGVDVNGVVDCSLDRTDKLCIDVARYVPFSTGTDHDVVIGIDKSNEAVMIDPWTTPMTTTALTNLTTLVPMNAIARSVHAGDFDGDGKPELVAAFAPTSQTSGTGAVLVCTMTNGLPTACQDLVGAIITAAAAGGPMVNQCFDAAPARISYRDPTVAADPSSDIVVACRGEGTSIFRVRHGATLQVDRLANTAAPATLLRAGDVTGDHVDDVLLLEGDAVSSLVVYPQCTSRDAAGCHGASTSASTTGGSP